MNIYSELWELLSPRAEPGVQLCFGTIRGVGPLTVSVEGAEVSQGLICPRGTVFHPEDVGREVALLSCSGGFLLLFQVEGGDV